MEHFIRSSPTAVNAELNTVALIARRNMPFNFLQYLIPTLKHVASDSVAVNDMTCSRTKASYLLNECLAVHAHENLIQELQDVKGFSFLCDKATDNTMHKIFCINVRFVTNGAPKTHLYRSCRAW